MSNFIYDSSTISHLESMLSSDRFETYVALAEGNRIQGLKLYKKNILLSHRFYTIIHILEVCLRNKIDEALSKRYGLSWFENPKLKLSETQREQIKVSFQDAKRGRLISALPFGFWSYFFGRSYDELWRQDIRFIFKKELPLKRSYVAAHLKNIRILRNRIAHHECILKMDTPGLETASFELLNLLSPVISDWVKSELLTSAPLLT